VWQKVLWHLPLHPAVKTTMQLGVTAAAGTAAAAAGAAVIGAMVYPALHAPLLLPDGAHVSEWLLLLLLLLLVVEGSA